MALLHYCQCKNCEQVVYGNGWERTTITTIIDGRTFEWSVVAHPVEASVVVKPKRNRPSHAQRKNKPKHRKQRPEYNGPARGTA